MLLAPDPCMLIPASRVSRTVHSTARASVDGTHRGRGGGGRRSSLMHLQRTSHTPLSRAHTTHTVSYARRVHARYHCGTVPLWPRDRGLIAAVTPCAFHPRTVGLLAHRATTPLSSALNTRDRGRVECDITIGIDAAGHRDCTRSRERPALPFLPRPPDSAPQPPFLRS
jgi:hypothetical protein